MKRTKTRPMQGLTVIELLILVSILALVIVFATPLILSDGARAEVDRAIDITEDSVEQARTMARLYKTNVVVRLESAADRPAKIRLSIPRSGNQDVMSEIREEISLPDEVRLLGGDLMIEFYADGTVDLPATVTLASTRDLSRNYRLVIE